MYRTLSTLCLLVIALGGCSLETKEELFTKGMKQINAHRPESAISYFKNALDKDQNYFAARLQLAKAYSAIGKLDSAEKELQKASRQRPDSKEIRIELAKVHVRTSQADEALSEINDLASADCKESVVLETAGMAHALKGEFGAALGLLTRAIAADNAQPSASLALARVYLMSGNDREAETLLTEMLKKDPAGTGALYMLAELQVKRNETSAAK